MLLSLYRCNYARGFPWINKYSSLTVLIIIWVYQETFINQLNKSLVKDLKAISISSGGVILSLFIVFLPSRCIKISIFQSQVSYLGIFLSLCEG